MTDDDIDRLVRQSQRANGGCCSDPSWRGHLCEYHSGYEAGLDAARTFFTPKFPPPTSGQ